MKRNLHHLKGKLQPFSRFPAKANSQAGFLASPGPGLRTEKPTSRAPPRSGQTRPLLVASQACSRWSLKQAEGGPHSENTLNLSRGFLRKDQRTSRMTSRPSGERNTFLNILYRLRVHVIPKKLKCHLGSSVRVRNYGAQVINADLLQIHLQLGPVQCT